MQSYLDSQYSKNNEKSAADEDNVSDRSERCNERLHDQFQTRSPTYYPTTQPMTHDIIINATNIWRRITHLCT